MEGQLRQAIRDSVNRPSRKPFSWGGLAGYQQLEAISQALEQIPADLPGRSYLQAFTPQVVRVLTKNKSLANHLQEAHTALRKIAACLRYPPPSHSLGPNVPVLETNAQQVTQELENLLEQFIPAPQFQPQLSRLWNAFRKRWQLYGPDLLYCYAIPGLPQDNLQLETLFGCLRRQQRRISGQKSTRELRDFGQVQVLFLADSQEALLAQIQQVPWDRYQSCLRLLEKAEAPRQFFHRLHHNPLHTIQDLTIQHSARSIALSLLFRSHTT